MTDTFSPPVPPQLDTTKQTTARVLTTDFGDGYSQRAGDGLNVIGEEWSVSWGALSSDDADTIEGFLNSQAGWKAFNWTPPGYASSLKFTCVQWGRGFRNGPAHSLSATFKQVFDL